MDLIDGIEKMIITEESFRPFALMHWDALFHVFLHPGAVLLQCERGFCRQLDWTNPTPLAIRYARPGAVQDEMARTLREPELGPYDVEGRHRYLALLEKCYAKQMETYMELRRMHDNLEEDVSTTPAVLVLAAQALVKAQHPLQPSLKSSLERDIRTHTAHLTMYTLAHRINVTASRFHQERKEPAARECIALEEQIAERYERLMQSAKNTLTYTQGIRGLL